MKNKNSDPEIGYITEFKSISRKILLGSILILTAGFSVYGLLFILMLLL